MARIFLSHASVDKPTVRRLAESLRAAGHEPWVDENEILVGESIPQAVERGLREADFVIFCLSNAAADRGWVEAERDATMMQQLRERKPRILPIRLDQVNPPYLTAHLAYVDIFPDDAAFRRGIERLVSSIAAHLGREAGSQEAAMQGLPAGVPPVSSGPMASASATHAYTHVERWRQLLDNARQKNKFVRIDSELRLETGRLGGYIRVGLVRETAFELSIPIHDSQGLKSVCFPITFKQVDDIDTDGEQWLRVILLRPIVVREYRPIFG